MSEKPKNQILVEEFVSQAKIHNGILIFPTLWSLDKLGHYRYWILRVSIENPDNNKIIEINEDYINRKKIPKDYGGCYWTESGVKDTENPIISEKTFVMSGKSLTSKNFTTPFTQALLDARSDFNFKIRKGSVLNKKLLSIDGTILDIPDLMKMKHRGKFPWRVFTMAVHDVNKSKNWKHVIYPCKVQPKLDGTLFVVIFHPLLPDLKLSNSQVVKMDGYSRGRESYEGQDHILWELYPILQKHPGLHLVGELWKKGFSLQDISGVARRKNDTKLKSVYSWDYNIFDSFYIDRPNETFEIREKRITDIMKELNDYYKDNVVYVKQIPSYLVENKSKLMDKYEKFLSDGQEGAVIRNLDSKYEVGIDKERRSYTTLKLKPRFDDEWPVVGYDEGSGKEKGAVIWICAENDKGVSERLSLKEELPSLDQRKTFSVTPNLPYDVRYNIFNKFKTNNNFFDEKIKGQLLTIGYSNLSKDKLPLQPKALRFRDLKINELLLS